MIYFKTSESGNFLYKDQKPYEITFPSPEEKRDFVLMLGLMMQDIRKDNMDRVAGGSASTCFYWFTSTCFYWFTSTCFYWFTSTSKRHTDRNVYSIVVPVIVCLAIVLVLVL